MHSYLPVTAPLWLCSRHLSGIVTKPDLDVFPALLLPVSPVSANSATVQADLVLLCVTVLCFTVLQFLQIDGETFHQLKSYDSLYWVVWNQTRSISRVCLYKQMTYGFSPEVPFLILP